MEMNHVLVVEDDKEIRQGIEIYLKSQGYEVYQAEYFPLMKSMNGYGKKRR